MNDTHIEAAVRDLHTRLWRARASLWPADALPSPVEMLDPAAAARLLGIEFEVHDELGSRFSATEARFEIAGLLDRQAKKIAISRRFAPETQRFTAAHELGHWLLHPGNIMHRDRPVGGLEFGPMKRPQPEREADRFAALISARRRYSIARTRSGGGVSAFVREPAFRFAGAALSGIDREHGDTVA